MYDFENIDLYLQRNFFKQKTPMQRNKSNINQSQKGGGAASPEPFGIFY